MTSTSFVRAVPAGGYVTACGSGVEPGNEACPDDPLNTWRAYVVRVTETGAVRWQATYGSRHANNAAEFVLPTRDGGFAVVADSDEHGVGEGANFALYKLAGDPPRGRRRCRRRLPRIKLNRRLPRTPSRCACRG